VSRRRLAAGWALVIILTALGAGLITGLITGFVTVRGWGDWTIGTNTSYCGVYWPHLDFFCQSGR
jgi:hypothetical protein